MKLTPAQIAELDQLYAQSNRQLGEMVRDVVDRLAVDDLHNVGPLLMYQLLRIEPYELAKLATMAMLRLARHEADPR